MRVWVVCYVIAHPYTDLTRDITKSLFTFGCVWTCYHIPQLWAELIAYPYLYSNTCMLVRLILFVIETPVVECRIYLRHAMMTSYNGKLSALLVLFAGTSPVAAGNSPVTDVSLILAWSNGWVNYRDAGDLRRHRAHYDVTVMCTHRMQ